MRLGAVEAAGGDRPWRSQRLESGSGDANGPLVAPVLDRVQTDCLDFVVIVVIAHGYKDTASIQRCQADKLNPKLSRANENTPSRLTSGVYTLDIDSL